MKLLAVLIVFIFVRIDCIQIANNDKVNDNKIKNHNYMCNANCRQQLGVKNKANAFN